MVEETAKPVSYFGITNLGTYSYLEGPSGFLELERVSEYLIKSGRLITMDLETTGKNPLLDEILLVSFTYNGKHAYVFSPLTLDITPFLDVLRNNPVNNQFIKFDYEFIKVKYDIDMHIEWDTQVTHSLATAGIAPEIGGNTLANLSKRYLRVPLNKTVREDFLVREWRSDEAISYAAMDSLSAHQLMPVTKKILEASECWHIWEEIEKPLIKVIAGMELRGVNVDLDSILNLRDKYQKLVDDITSKIEAMTTYDTTIQVTCPICKNRGKKKLTCENCSGNGKVTVTTKASVNPGSPKQIIEYFDNNNVPVPFKERSNGTKTKSVDEKSLKKIKHPLARLLEEYREYSKALSAFLIPWSTPCDTNPDGKYNPKTGCIHAEITQTDTRTGRTSMKSPNLQQVPRESEFRHVFIAPPGHTLIVIDYSQYELRVLAELSGDETMKAMFLKRAALVSKLEEELDKIGEVAYTKEIGEAYPEIAKLHTLIERDNDIHSQTAITIFKLDPSSIDYDSDNWKLKRASAKAQPLSAKVLTPTEWTTIGKIKVGDYVMTGQRVGVTAKVTNIHKHGIKDTYRLVLADGASTRATKDHLWSVYELDVPKVVTTEQIMTSLFDNNGHPRWTMDYVPFYLSSHEPRIRFRETFGKREIVKVEKDKPEECWCLELDKEPHTYVTDNFIITHNCVSFGIPYGSGPRTVAERSNGAMTEDEARKTIDVYFETFPKIKEYIDETKKQCSIPADSAIAKDMGLSNYDLVWSESLGKRKRFYSLPGKSNSNREEIMNREIRANIQRQAVNHRIQCVEGSTRIFVEGAGLINISSVCGKVSVWDGKQFSNATVIQTGTKPLALVEFADGRVLKCSPDHKILMEDRTWKTVEELSHMSPKLRVPVLTEEIPYWHFNESVNPVYLSKSRALLHVNRVVKLFSRQTNDGLLLMVDDNEYLRTLIRDMQELLLILGIKSSLISPTKLRVADVERLYSYIGYTGKKYSPDSGYDNYIKSITFTGMSVPMYDVVDSTTGRFVAGGTVVHNSTNADVTKLAMVMLDQEFSKPEYNGQVHLRLMVHDEIVVSCPKEMAKKVARVQIKIMKEASQRYVKTVPTEVGCIITDKWSK
jgi:DNA polymerase I-like protein with 3'-5' exonuclease and polymerase domains